MPKIRHVPLSWRVLLGLWVLLAAAPSAWTVGITIVNLDGPGEGFNDSTPVAPVGGNPGVTVGEQRLNVFLRAGEIWGARLSGTVDIEVWARFDPLSCDNTSATLGQARAFTFFRDFVGAPRPGTLYPVALANQFARLDLDPQNPDIIANFNSSLGQSGCLPTANWYYGLDRMPPAGAFDLLDTVLHELAHGLGFTTLVDLNTGAKSFGYDDVYLLHLEDHSTGKLFPVMSNAERAAAVKDPGDLHWTGPAVVAQSGFLAAGRHASGHVEIYAPATVAPGSSVSHFSNSLFPDELMEPFLVSRPDDRLAAALLSDLGWAVVSNAPSVVGAGSVLTAEDCPPGNGSIDPGENVTVEFQLRNAGAGLTGNLVATLLPSSGMAVIGPPQSYGALAAGGSPVARPFAFTALGSCGQTVTATLQLVDGSTQLGTVSFDLLLGRTLIRTQSFTNASPISIPASGRTGPAFPYPSSITVSGVTGTVRHVTVSLRGLTHGLSADADILLAGPDGQAVVLMSDAGNSSVNDINLTFDDQAPSALPGSGPIGSGTYRPTNLGGSDTFPGPAPAPPYDAILGVFEGKNANGTWSLYINDDRNPNTGTLAGGWSIHLDSDQGIECCRLADFQADLSATMEMTPNPVAVGSNVVSTIRVANAGPDAAFGVRLLAQIPAGLSFQSAQSTQGSCSNANGSILCSLGPLTAAQTVQLTFRFLTLTAGSVTQSVQLASQSTDPDPDNDIASAQLSIQARPTLSNVPNQTLLEDAPALVLPVTVSDPDTPAGALLLSARVTNTNLVPSSAVILGGVESNRTLTLTPAADQFGLATVILTVSDGYGTASDLFLLTVTAVNDPPTFLPGPDVEVQENEGAQVFPQWARDITPGPANETNQTVGFVVTNDAPQLFMQQPSLETDGTLTFAAATGASGLAAVSVILKDNGGRLNQGFDQSPPWPLTIRITPVQVIPPRLLSVRFEPNTLTLTWEAIPGKRYRVQFKPNLQEGEWEDLPGQYEATETVATATDIPQGPQRFYRIVLLP